MNSNWLLWGIILPILVFFVSMNTVFSYFTASVGEQRSSISTGIIRIGFSDDTKTNNVLVSSSSAEDITYIVPGDTLAFSGSVVNTGNAGIYVILRLNISLTKTNGTENIKKYYTYVNSTLTEIPATGYTQKAFVLATENAKQDILIEYSFADSFGDEYKNATGSYDLTAYAVQTANISDTEATSLLMTKATANS
ncbi:MAG: hypothetical protein E7351_01050 [Clostridiales bacterium]|nr:hypothetical protein [Clostridiales bacterium]